MSASSPTPPAKPAKLRIAGRILFATVCIGLAILAVLHYLRDQRLRQPAEEFIATFNLEERRPAQAERIRRVPTADLAYEVAGEVAVEDALGEIPLAQLDEAGRELWLADIARVGEELSEAEELLLDGLQERPGWAYHRSLLGVTDFVKGKGSDPRWLQTLDLAISRSPGDAYLRTFAGYAMIDSWGNLDEAGRAKAELVFGAALSDSEFVSNSFLAIADLLGPQKAAALIPDSPAPLVAAVEAYAEEGNAVSAAPLFVRWEKAEWRARSEDLESVRFRRRLNDFEGLQQACALWLNKHRAQDFDTPGGRRQAEQILELCPATPSRWTSNRSRAELVRYFLNGRIEHLSRRVTRDVLTGISDFPLADAATLAVRAGDLYRAEELAETAVQNNLGWTSYLVGLGWHHLEKGDPEAAAAALETISPAARRECEVALLRRALGEATARRVAVEPGVFLEAYPSAFWADAGVPICIDPAAKHQRLAVYMDVHETPTLLSFGFDGGRSRTRLLAPGRRQIQLPLEDRSGRHFFTYEVVAGGEVNPDLAVLE